MRNTDIFLTFPLFLLFLIPSLSFSQNRDLDFSRKITFDIPYVSDPQSFNKNGNEILTGMAKEVLKEPWKVRIRISFDLQIRLAHDTFGKTLMKINTIHSEIEGDTRYRLFDISGVLIPSRMNIRIGINNKNDSMWFREMQISNRPFGIVDEVSIGSDWLSVNPTTDTLVISSVELFYDEEARNAFNLRLDQINDYYASGALLDSLNRLARSISLTDWSQIPVNYFCVREIDHAIDLMEKRRFPEILSLQDHDPLNWIGSFTAADKYSRSLTFTFYDEVMKSSAIPGGENIGSIADYFVSRVLNYIDLSNTIDEINGGIYSDWLDNYFQFRAFDDEFGLVSLIAWKMFPDAGRDTILTFIASNFYRAYQRRSINLINHNQYADAYALMKHALLFSASCSHLHGIEDDEILHEAARGIYNSFIGIAKTCLEGRNYPMAGNYLGKAVDYRSKNGGIVFSDSLYNSVFSDMFFMRISDCDNLLAEKRYCEALSCYIYAEQLYDTNQCIPIRERLEQKKREAGFRLFLEVIGRTILVNGKY